MFESHGGLLSALDSELLLNDFFFFQTMWVITLQCQAFIEQSQSFILSHFVAAKFGVEPSGCVELAKHVSLGCPNLEFCGLMTIGLLDYSSTPENFKVTISTLCMVLWSKCFSLCFLNFVKPVCCFRHYQTAELRFAKH